jgi:peroxiredoxin
MNARWNANTVLLAVFVLILLGAGVDYGRRVLGGTGQPDVKASAEAIKSSWLPAFKVGDSAPDFALPDANSEPHKLSELVKSDSMLFFACGCENCKQIQTWLSRLVQQKKIKHMPNVITVTSAPPEAEKAWIRDTSLKQKILYAPHGDKAPDVMSIYKGKPCPRIYLLKGDRTVKFIGKSMSEVPGVQMIGMEIVKELGTVGSTSQDMMRLMGSGSPTAPPSTVKPPAKPDPTLPPYAQPQNVLPGGS